MSEAKMFIGDCIQEKEPQKIISVLTSTGKLVKGEPVKAVFGSTILWGINSCVAVAENRLIYLNNSSGIAKTIVISFGDISEIANNENFLNVSLKNGDNVELKIKSNSYERQKLFDFLFSYKDIGASISALSPIPSTLNKKPKEVIEEYLLIHNFEKSRTLVSGNIFTGTPTIFIDDIHKMLAVIKNKKSEPKIYSFSDILDFEVLENGGSIMKGHAGSAIVGGLAFGVVGAIAGGARKKKVSPTCNSLMISITLNDPMSPNIIIPFISTQTKTDSLLYKTATHNVQNMVSILTVMQNQGRQVPNSETQNIDVADEIKKLSALKNEGILTDDEFIAKKKQLLGI